MTSQVICRKYVADTVTLPAGMRKLKRFAFVDIVKTLKKGDVQQRACVNYKLHALVYENSSSLKRIIGDRVREKTDREELNTTLTGVIEFMKYTYGTHLKETDDDPYHSMKYSVRHGTYTDTTKLSKCVDSNNVFNFLHEIEDAIVGRSVQVEKIQKSAEMKFEMYMGHKARARIQVDLIKAIIEWVKKGRERKRFVAFLPRSQYEGGTRETTRDPAPVIWKIWYDMAWFSRFL